MVYGLCNTPDGLYFSGYSSDDANPDIGDSAITETWRWRNGNDCRLAVTRFAGAGGLNISNKMMEIGIGHSPNFSIPPWNFKGICLGIDLRPAAEKIISIINAEISQIGAGIVRPPIACFEKAIDAYALKLGIVRNKVSIIYFLASYVAKQLWILNAKMQTKDELHQFGAAHLLL